MDRTRLIVVLAVLGPFLWFFGSALLGDRMFVYRDSAHYYYPLFERTRAEWSQGGTPLWNPRENCGEPLLANNTASVFYPGKLIFATPLDFATCYKLYITAHFLLAAGGAYVLARRWQASSMAAGVCGLTYAFGGNVLIQSSNVIFLIGAAWLPLALFATDKMLVDRRVSWALGLGVILALMVLGGDPQAAYHAGLLATLYAVVLWRVPWRGNRETDVEGKKETTTSPGSIMQRLSAHRLTLLALAATSGAVLAAVQILPSMEWARRCDRSAFDEPRSIYEIPAHLARQQQKKKEGNGGVGGEPRITSGLLGEPRLGTHHGDIYDFSVGPWRLPELIWPNISGRQYPVNRRWLQAISYERRGAWTPSLYMGLLPLLLAIGSLRLRSGTAVQRWMTWTVLLGALAALGWYGLGWLIHESRWLTGGGANEVVLLGQPVGGLYWLMVTMLPGYAYFRYPAKLLVVAALGVSVLAALGWDRMFAEKPVNEKPVKLRRTLAILGGISLVGAIVALLVRPFWKTWFQKAVPAAFFGPFDAAGSANDLLISMLHAMLLCGLLWWLLGRLGKGQANRWAGAALLITALDLALANGWMVATAPQELWQQQPQMASRIEAEENRLAISETIPFRIFRETRPDWEPVHWSQSSSTSRQEEGLQWDRNTLLPKYHLQTNLSICESRGAMSSNDYQIFLDVARRNDAKREVLDTLSVRYLVMKHGTKRDVFEALSFRPAMLRQDPSDSSSSSMQLVEENEAGNTTLWHNPDAFPRTWIVHEIETMPLLKSTASPAEIRRRTQQVLMRDGQLRDFQSQAVVETDEKDIPLKKLLVPLSSDDEPCRIVIDTPRHVAIEVELNSPGLIVLNDLYYPGWIADISDEHSKVSQRATIIRTNRFMRGVYLPAGKHRIDYRYQPKSYYTGATISTIGWGLLVILSTIVWWRKRKFGTKIVAADSIV